mmetsp:Transcript_24414/g.30354  ORF Transcript_24414/g.30354 Transcript_24414/m.30354 type:complete len:81 (+) Transcript_24414:1619-1861(+)
MLVLTACLIEGSPSACFGSRVLLLSGVVICLLAIGSCACLLNSVCITGGITGRYLRSHSLRDRGGSCGFISEATQLVVEG